MVADRLGKKSEGDPGEAAGMRYVRGFDMSVGASIDDDYDVVVGVPIDEDLDVVVGVPIDDDYDVAVGVPIDDDHDVVLGVPIDDDHDVAAGVPIDERQRAEANPAPATQDKDAGKTPGKESRKPLGQVLIENGLITKAQLDEVLETQKKKGGFLGRLLIEMGIVKHDKIMKLLLKEKKWKVSYVNLLKHPISTSTLETIPKEICLKHRLLAIAKEGSNLTVAMVDPLDKEALKAIQETCPDLNANVMICSWSHFKKVAGHVYGARFDLGVPEKETSPNPPAQDKYVRKAPIKEGYKPLGQLLIENGIITEGQLDEALDTQEKQGGLLGRILFETGIVEHNKIMEFLLKSQGRKISSVDLLMHPIPKSTLETIPKQICLKYRLLAMNKIGRSMTVAMVDPLDEEALKAVQEACPALDIKVVMCSWDHYKIVVAHVYGEKIDEDEEFHLPTFGLLAKQFGKTKRSLE